VILFLILQKHSKLWFKELKTKAPKRLKNHTDHKRTSQYFKLILRTTHMEYGVGYLLFNPVIP
ncbi:MAG: hypothetical protein IJT13_02320, partial [Bacteroidaceae bacterium]|nr:hypothetical protein [Bacteroidaceae bacterium]